VTDRWAGMLFYREPTSVELHRKHTNPWRCWVRGSVCPQHNPLTRRFDVIRVARGYVIATRCCVLQLCARTTCTNATKLSRLLVTAHANADFLIMTCTSYPFTRKSHLYNLRNLA
jgi:hypothetical protein